MSHANLSPAALGRATGKTGGDVTQWLDGTIKSIKGDTAAKIQDATGYNARWLATGKGDRLPAPRGLFYACTLRIAPAVLQICISEHQGFPSK